MCRTSIYYGTQENEIKKNEGRGFFSDKLGTCTILRAPVKKNMRGVAYFEAVAFGGKRAKPDFHFIFQSVERREKYITQYLDGQKRRAAYKAEYRKTRRISSHAAAAKAIRAELKAAFPGVAFSVRSDSFAGGNSVDIDWTDGPMRESVEAITRKYQYGNFNSMEDIYENSNRRDDLPQAKYVMTQRSMSKKTEEDITKKLAEYWGVDMSDARAVEARTCCEAHELVYRDFVKTNF